MPCWTGTADDVGAALDVATSALASGPKLASVLVHELHAGRDPTTASTMMGQSRLTSVALLPHTLSEPELLHFQLESLA